jgi:hypothetical protein
MSMPSVRAYVHTDGVLEGSHDEALRNTPPLSRAISAAYISLGRALCEVDERAYNTLINSWNFRFTEDLRQVSRASVNSLVVEHIKSKTPKLHPFATYR